MNPDDPVTNTGPGPVALSGKPVPGSPAGGSRGAGGDEGHPALGGTMKHWMGPVLVALIGAFMAILDSSIVNVAVPTIMSVFNASTNTVQWISTIYLLASGCIVPFSGWMGDRFGIKNLYIGSLIIFVLGSLLCGLAWDINSLIVARVLQAVGGGMIMPTIMAMIYRMVPRDKMGGAMGIFGIALLVAPALGPTLGGYLVEYVNWRWIFTINLPIGVIGVLLAIMTLPEFKSAHPGKLDFAGAATSATMLFTLLLALSKGTDWGWTSEPIVLLFFASAVSLVLFIYIETTIDNPLLDLRVFRYASFTAANLTTVVTTVGLYAGLFYIPLFLQSIRGIGAMETGLLMMPGALVTAVMMPITGKLFDKIGAKALVISGLLMLSVLTLNFSNLNLATATGTITMWIIFRGAVMAFAMMPAQTASLIDIPNELIGRASSISNIIRSVAGSFGLAVLTSILTARQAFHGSRLAWSLTLSNPVVADSVAKLGGLAGGGARGKGLAAAYLSGLVAKASFVNAIDDVFIVAGLFTLLALVPALFLKNKRKAAAEGAGGMRSTAIAAE